MSGMNSARRCKIPKCSLPNSVMQPEYPWYR
nr:MAG TPA: hypothetical protein [Caudoviricetes sp.]